jgi:hypothetical protein
LKRNKQIRFHFSSFPAILFGGSADESISTFFSVSFKLSQKEAGLNFKKEQKTKSDIFENEFKSIFLLQSGVNGIKLAVIKVRQLLERVLASTKRYHGL